MTNSISSNPLARHLPPIRSASEAARETPYRQTPEDWVEGYTTDLIREYYRRNFDDALVLYKARQPGALAFHKSLAHIRIVTAPNQGGKTLSGVAEASRIVRGQHPAFPKP